MSAFDHDTISRYLDGEMNAEEQKAFEEQMQQDADLKKEVELFKEVNETLKMKLHPDESESALRNTLEEMRDQYFQSKTKVVSFNRFRWMAVAASILIAVVSLTIWAPWKKDLYKQYAYIKMPGVEERGAPGDSLLKQVADDFNKKKYAETVRSFEIVLKNDPQNSFLHYYYAIALQLNGEIEKSRSEFLPLYNGSSSFKYGAAFYMALSYLKEKDKTTCKEWLDKIPADADMYGKAQELLKKL
jgi:hypothetical protein